MDGKYWTYGAILAAVAFIGYYALKTINTYLNDSYNETMAANDPINNALNKLAGLIP